MCIASCATPVIHVWYLGILYVQKYMCITCVEIQVYYMCRNIGVLHV